MPNGNKECPICKLGAENVHRSHDYSDGATYDCPRCGRYKISGTAEAKLESDDTPRLKLSAQIRALCDNKKEVPLISSGNISEIENGIPDYSASDKQRILLQRIAAQTAFPGKSVQLTKLFDYPLAYAVDGAEFTYYLKALLDRKLLILREGSYNDLAVRAEITPDGWDYLEKLSTDIDDRKQAFVAMSFSDTMKPVWEGAIRPAIEKAGYKAYRVDAEPHVSRIDMKIISEIQNSRFVVADVTEQKQGVYFEAGYAIGLGLPVFWCVREDDKDNCHFDTRQYYHIIWKTEDDLRDRLYEFTCAIVGKRNN